MSFDRRAGNRTRDSDGSVQASIVTIGSLLGCAFACHTVAFQISPSQDRPVHFVTTDPRFFIRCGAPPRQQASCAWSEPVNVPCQSPVTLYMEMDEMQTVFERYAMEVGPYSSCLADSRSGSHGSTERAHLRPHTWPAADVTAALFLVTVF